MTFGLMLAIGIGWMTYTAAPVQPPEEPAIEIQYGPWVAAVGGGLVVLGGLVLLRRYLLVKNILCHGVLLKGTVEAADRFDTNMHGNSHTIRTNPTYAYYVTIRYAMYGVERKVRVKLMHSPSTYGIKQDGEVDLLALESKPHRPLIRAVYLPAWG